MATYFKGKEVCNIYPMAGPTPPTPPTVEGDFIDFELPFPKEDLGTFVVNDNVFIYNNGTTQDACIYMFNRNADSVVKVFDPTDLEYDPISGIYYRQFYKDAHDNIFVGFVAKESVTVPSGTNFVAVLRFDNDQHKFVPAVTIPLEDGYGLDAYDTYNFFEYVTEDFSADYTFYSGLSISGLYGLYCYDNNDYENRVFRLVDGSSDLFGFTQYCTMNGVNLIANHYKVYKFDPENNSIEELQIEMDSGKTFNEPKLKSFIWDDKVLILHSTGVAFYDFDNNVIVDIYNNGEYGYAPFGDIVRTPDGSYLYYNTKLPSQSSGNLLVGVIRIDIDERTYEQAVPNVGTTTEWHNLIETEIGIFLLNTSTSIMSWVNKWNEETRSFDNISGNMGRNYVGQYFEGEFYFKCFNPTSSADRTKFFKYDMENNSYTVVSTNASSSTTGFKVVRFGNDVLLYLASNRALIRNEVDGMFTTLVTASVTNDFINGFTELYRNDNGEGIYAINSNTPAYRYIYIYNPNVSSRMVQVRSGGVALVYYQDPNNLEWASTHARELSGFVYLFNGKVGDKFVCLQYSDQQLAIATQYANSDVPYIYDSYNMEDQTDVLRSGNILCEVLNEDDGKFYISKDYIGTSLMAKTTSLYVNITGKTVEEVGVNYSKRYFVNSVITPTILDVFTYCAISEIGTNTDHLLIGGK